MKKKDIKKNLKKLSKKKTKKSKSSSIFTLTIVIIIALIVGCFYLYDIFFAKDIDEPSSLQEISSTEHVHEKGIIYDKFQIRFLELGNGSTGDSTYIKAGDIDILIDAGSEKNSAIVIEEAINNYCNDGKLEYVITTHADSDHISGMSGIKTKSKNYKGEDVEKTGILYYYDIDTLIDFSITEKTR